MDFIKQLYYKYRNFILYGIIGGFCATLDFVIYSGLCYVNMNHLWANIISTHCGIFCSFLLNRSYNFKVKDKTGLRFLSFYIIGLIGLALSEGLLFLMVNMAGWNKYIAKFITVFVVAVFQFVLNKFITDIKHIFCVV